MRFSKVLFLLLLLSGFPEILHSQQIPVVYDERDVPAYTLPDPLMTKDGKIVKNSRQWMKVRRPELMDLFRDQMFGYEPAAPDHVEYEVVKVVPDVFDGLATMKEVKLFLEPSHEHYCLLSIFVPNKRSGPAPAFLGINFRNNHVMDTLSVISLPPADLLAHYMPSYKMWERGEASPRWPIRYILSHGYATVSYNREDADPDDRKGYDLGIRKVYDAGSRSAKSWGTISAWAWSLSRALDYLEEDPDIDASRVAVHGHSRLGKTALWAGAIDQRFALVISNDSGCGGAALSRRGYGETVKIINNTFPYWFCDNFKQYSGNEAALPFDQHELIALIAPRPVYVASASEDLWADPYGEYLSLVNASPVYKLFGYEGFTSAAIPPVEYPRVEGRMGHHIRKGKHDMLIYDWANYIAFADRYLK